MTGRNGARSRAPRFTLQLFGLFLVMIMTAGVVGPSYPWVPWDRDGDGKPDAIEALEEARELATKQRWGTADGLPSEGGGPEDAIGMPVSEQSKYPPLAYPQVDGLARNEATVSIGKVARSGYNPTTSKEIPEERSSTERTFRNTDGTLTTEYSATPVNYRRADGTWAPIDPALVGSRGGWRNTADEIGVQLAGSTSSGDLVTVTLDDEHEFAYGLGGARAVQGQASGATVVYPGVADGTDLKLESVAGGVKETLVLHGKNAPRSWTFPLRLKGLTAKLVDGSVSLVDRDGRERARIPAGFMVDSAVAGDIPAPAVSHGVRYDLVDGGGSLRVSVDSAWLDDPARVFPVLVDPTVTNFLGTQTRVVGAGTVNNPSELLIGRAGSTQYTSFVAFPTLASSLPGHKIFGAQLQLTNFDSTTCQPQPMTVHKVDSAWPGSGAPASSTQLGGASFSHGYIKLGATRSACPAASELIDLGTGGQELVQGWVRGTAPNHGIALRAVNTATSAGFKKFTGGNTANPPRLFVTHTPYDAAYSITNAIPSPYVTRVVDGYVQLTARNTSGTTWTAGAYDLAYKVFDANTNAYLGVETSAPLAQNVAPGGQVTFNAKIGKRAEGKYLLDFSMRHNGKLFTDEQIAPARITLQIFNIPPVVVGQYPPNGQSVETLQPQLWAKGQDHESDPFDYKFEVCEKDPLGNPVACFDSGFVGPAYWTIPKDRLRWDRVYLWRTWLRDSNGAVSAGIPYSALIASVPQPEVTSRLGNAPYTANGLGFDPLVGNYTTAAIDASAATVGPELTVARTYNSLDPRTDLTFGVGWASRYDTRVVPDADGSGNLIVTYPDGQQVRFGRNPDGSFTAPPGRFATLTTVAAGGWQLVDKDRTVYTFNSTGALTFVQDSAARKAELAYDANGKLSRATSLTSNRSLFFTWNAEGHVQDVKTEAVDGSQLTWTYSYTGNQLRSVCDPHLKCTQYAIESRSHYRSIVLDSRPESYWRLGEPGGDTAGSEVSVKLTKDNAQYVGGVVHGEAGRLEGSDDKAVSLSGGAHVKLPDRAMNRFRDLSVEFWFKTTNGGPLVGYQEKPIGESAGTGVPMVYVGSDGKLRGQFWTGTANPIASPTTVTDNQWHHVVLAGSVATQSLYLDGVKVGTLTGEIDHARLEYAQIGKAYNSIPTFPGISTGQHSAVTTQVDEVAVYARPLGDNQVRTHFAARASGIQITTVSLPSGRIAAKVAYDNVNDRMREYIDANGGRWLLDKPGVGGTETNIIRTVRVVDPGGRPQYYDFDGLKGRILRQVSPVGTGPRAEDIPGKNCSRNLDGILTCNGLTIVLGTRTFDYDQSGFQTTITDEMGSKATLVHDSRGNLTRKVTCRATNDCQTTYYEYQPATADLTDPRTDKLTAVRDARSSGPTDNTYLTTSVYTSFGDLQQETSPDGGSTFHSYTNGTSDAVGGGKEPARLLKTTSDPRGVTTTNFYYSNGDLAKVQSETEAYTEYTYDVLGRVITKTDVSDAVPGGAKTTYKYDKLGRVVEVTHPATVNAVTGTTHTHRETAEYDPDGNIVKSESVDLADPATVRSATREYDAFGRLIKVVDPEGNEAHYGYDGYGNRTWMIDPGGVKTAYTYTNRNKVAQVKVVGWHGKAVTPGATGDAAPDPTVPVADLVVAANQYDNAGRLSIQSDAMGRRTHYLYYGDGLVREIQARADADPDTLPVVLQQNTYDAAGNLVRQVGPGGRVSTREVDATGRLKATVIEPDTLQRRTQYTYDLSGNVIQLVRTGAHSNTGAFSASYSEIIDYDYDSHGRQTRESLRGPNGSVVTKTEYDDRNLPTKVIGARGNVVGATPADHTTEYRYDTLGRTTEVIAPPVAVESGGGAAVTSRPTTVSGYNAFGEVTHSRNAAGHVSTALYDRAGRVVRAEAPAYHAPGAPGPVVPTTTLDYDPAGRVIRSTDAVGAVSRVFYDQRGRVVERQDPDPANPADPGASWRYSYTHTGQVLSVTDPTARESRATYDQFDRPITSTVLETTPAPAAYTTAMGYDAFGNLETVTSPKNEVTRYAYDRLGQRTSVTDPAGVVAQFGYDGFGNQVYTRDAEGRAHYSTLDQAGNKVNDLSLNATGQVIRTAGYTYDIAGNLLTAGDGSGKLTRFAYDALGQLTQQIEPVTDTETITTSFGYDVQGNRSRFTDGRGNKTVYTHNTLGALESVIEPSTAAHQAASNRTWTAIYDTAGRATTLNSPGGVSRSRTYDGLGRVTNETGSGTTAATAERVLGYDAAGRTTSLSAPGGTNAFAYNGRGQLISATGPSGNATFGYDEQGRVVSRVDAAGTSAFTYLNGRMTAVQDGLTGASIGFTYNPAGLPDKIDYGSGRVRQFGYDDFGRETSDVTKNTSAAVVASVEYGYDINHRLTSKTTAGTAGAGAQSYTYDQVGRMTSWTSGAATTAYAWDASGNRITNGAKTSTFDERNRLLSDGDYTYDYSARGTLQSRTSSGLAEAFSFDAFDRLITAGGASYTYDALDRPITRGAQPFRYAGGEMDAVSDGTATYGRGAGGELVSLSQGADKRLLLSDRHGDVIGGFDPAAVLTTLPDSTAYDPFGKKTASTGTGRNVGFQGDWTDPSTGQVNMGARWYEPGTGSFTSRDTMFQGGPGSGGFNRYAYGSGGPVNGIDPDGRCFGNIQLRWMPVSWCVEGAIATQKAVRHVGRNPQTITNPVRTLHENPAVGHAVLDVAGMAPGPWGLGFDALNASWYASEGRYYEAVETLLYALAPLNGVGKRGGQPGRNGSGASQGGARPGQGSGVGTGRGPDGLPGKGGNTPGAGKNGVPDPRKSANPRAGSRAAQQRAAHQAAVARTVGAKAAAASAVKANPLPVLAAASKPRIANAAHVVSPVANAPAKAVQSSAANVQDMSQVARTINEALVDAAKELVQDIAVSHAPDMLAAAGMPYADFIGEFAVGKRKGASRKGHDARNEARGGGSCERNLASNSFDGSTPVLMGDGSLKPIQEVRVGDQVRATDPTSGETGVRTVTDTRSHQAERLLYEVTISTDTGDGTVVATDKHPFWVESLQKWVNAEDLKPGYTFETADHRPATVSGIRSLAPDRQVYNLTVDGLHTYYVVAGHAAVVTHNEDPCDTGTATIHQYADKHFSIEVTHGGKTTHTHREGGVVMWPNGEGIATPIRVAKYEPRADMPPTRSITVSLPNARQAAAYQEYMMGEGETGVYDADTATCLHHCTDVLNVGGLKDAPYGEGVRARDVITYMSRLKRGK